MLVLQLPLDGTRTIRNCGICKETGHDRRNCSVHMSLRSVLVGILYVVMMDMLTTLVGLMDPGTVRLKTRCLTILTRQRDICFGGPGVTAWEELSERFGFGWIQIRCEMDKREQSFQDAALMNAFGGGTVGWAVVDVFIAIVHDVRAHLGQHFMKMIDSIRNRCEVSRGYFYRATS